MISNIPKGMVTDQFGMIGLLTFIRAAETEPNLVTLALGRSVRLSTSLLSGNTGVCKGSIFISDTPVCTG